MFCRNLKLSSKKKTLCLKKTTKQRAIGNDYCRNYFQIIFCIFFVFGELQILQKKKIFFARQRLWLSRVWMKANALAGMHVFPGVSVRGVRDLWAE